MKLKIIVSLFALLSFSSQAQKQDLKDINTQVWVNFTKAYETLDVNLFADLHSEDLIRVSGNSKTIKDKKKYIEGYKKWWHKSNKKQTISFRFLERIVANGKASERGIYKLTINPNTKEEKNHYGKFHVLLIKENDIWKILVDYDSTETNTIDASSYNNALAINAFDKF